MKTKHRILFSIALLIGLACHSRAAAKTTGPGYDELVGGKFTLVGARSPAPREFLLETHVTTLTPDGARAVTDTYRLRLKCVPAPVGETKGDTFTCVDFTVQFGAEPEVAIPSLKGLSYLLEMSSPTGQGDKPMLGIPHAPFENLADAKGVPIPPGNAFQVYDAFVDFHTFCDVFARPTHTGKGIQDLTTIGQKIVHAAAFSEPAIDLGSSIAKGSFFKNGEVTLEFKGLSVVDRGVCAVVTVDSGQSSFLMTMKPTPTMEIKTKGGSHYKGDVYLNLATYWVSLVVADEMVVSETTMPMPPNKVNTLIERDITIRSVQ